jgi:hypothetical protein
MEQPTTDQLLKAKRGSVDVNALKFSGLRGDPAHHMDTAALRAALAALPPAPKNQGTLALMVARGPGGERQLPAEVLLTPEGGMPGDRWAKDGRYGPQFQLATTRVDFARVVANGQPLELHGDNLYVDLDLSAANLPPGTRLSVGSAVLEITAIPHNGCQKFAARFGLEATRFVNSKEGKRLHLRGIYARIVQPGVLAVGDPVAKL